MVVTLGLAGWTVGLFVVGFMAISVILILTVLIQRPQGGGLSGAFGSSAGSGQTAFGAKTGDVLTYATIGMFVIWLLVAVGLVFATRPSALTPRPAPAAGAAVDVQEDENGAGAETTPSQGAESAEPAEAESAGSAPADGAPADPAPADGAPADPAPADGTPADPEPSSDPDPAPAPTEPAPGN